MPNTPAAIGQGISVLYAGPDVPVEMISLSHQLLGVVGDVVDLADEALMNAVTALSGSGPAYVFLLAEVMAAAGEKLGLPANLSMHLARQTVSGAGALMAAYPDTQAGQLRRNVTSEGGTTAAALSVLQEDNGVQTVFDRALRAACERGAELDN
jgi:pyrroline-5-carboxylate reductase